MLNPVVRIAEEIEPYSNLPKLEGADDKHTDRPEHVFVIAFGLFVGFVEGLAIGWLIWA